MGNFPVIEGTPCKNRSFSGWCSKGKCEEEEFLVAEKIDGGWSDWPDNWSKCSHQCGGECNLLKDFVIILCNLKNIKKKK